MFLSDIKLLPKGSPMLKNYFKIAIRNLLKQRLTSTINILGLAIGLTCCILVLLYVQFEFSFDAFHKNKDSIYRIIWRSANYGNDFENRKELPIPFYEALRSTFPEIINSTKIFQSVSNISFGTKELKKQEVIYTDSSFFDMFTFPLIIGDKKNALNSPEKTVITERLAGTFFGQENPIGKTLMIEGKQYIVSAVLKNVPPNSTLQFSFLLSSSVSPLVSISQSWKAFGIEGYIQLPDKYPSELLKSKLEGFINNHLRKNLNKNDAALLQPFSRVHLYSMNDYGIDTSGSITKVYIYGLIALLTLLLACINFINHSVSSITARYKEVGIRKIVGAEKKQIFIQYMSEIAITCSLSVILSICAVSLLLPKFNSLLNKSIVFDLTNSNIAAILLLLIISCLLAGSFPATMVSRFNPSEVLSKKLKLGYRGHFSGILLTFQFSLSIFFFISLIIMSKQIDCLFLKHSIEDSNSIVEFNVFYNPGNKALRRNSLNYFKDEVIKVNGVKYVTLGYGSGANKNLYCEGNELKGSISFVGPNYFETYGIKALDGRTFDAKRFPADSSETILVNKAFIQLNNMYSPVGKYIRLKESESFAKIREAHPDMFEGDPNPDKEFQVVGVVDDFSKSKLTQKFDPLIYRLRNIGTSLVTIKIENRNFQNSLNRIKEIYAKSFPGVAFRYWPLDDLIKRIYSTELKEKELVQYVTLFVLLITVSGVFGFTFMNISKRTKEIGIRKVIGASIKDIFVLLTKEYFILLLTAMILAVPPAYYFMNKWMEDYVVRAPFSPTYFIFGGVIISLIIILSICFHVFKTATANPVESLKSE